MKRIVTGIALFFILLPLGAETAASTEEIQRELRHLEDRYFRYLSYEERREAIRTMDRIMDMVVVQNQQIHSDREITPEQFDLLYKQIESIRDDRKKILQIIAIADQWDFSSQQLAYLIHTFSSDRAKVNCILQVQQNITDPRNRFLLLREIHDSEERRVLSQRLEL